MTNPIDWSRFFRGVGARRDLDASFVPELVESHEPVLLNTMSSLTAAVVAGRLLAVIANRGGTRVKPSAVSDLLERLARALPADIRNHADDEVLRILEWLRNPPVSDDTPDDPQLEAMHEGDVETRIATALYALEQGFDLSLEYFDVEREIWPSRRVRPIRVESADDPDDAVLFMEHTGGVAQVAFMDIRWLMPVERRPIPSAHEARVLDFPFGKSRE